MRRTFDAAWRAGRPAFVGCLHLLPLPGSAGWGGSLEPVLARCRRELAASLAAGVDGLLLENTFDVPYQRGVADAGTVAAMAVAAAEVRRATDLPIGVQVLAAADLAALDLAIACDLDFVRCEGFAYAHVADEGLVQGEAARLLRRRAHLRAEHVALWADVKKKHGSHALTGDLDLRAFASGAVFCGADGLVVTGVETGAPTRLDEVDAARGLGVPVVVGSGVTVENIASYAGHADVLVVGSACKSSGRWRDEVDEGRVRALVAALHRQEEPQ